MAVVRPWLTAHSTVRSKTSGRSPSRPNTKLPLIMTPSSSQAARSRARSSRPRFWGLLPLLQVVGARASRSRRIGCAARPRAARSIRSPRRTESTVAAPWNSRPMPRMPANKALGEAAVAEQVIVEEVQVPARQALDLGERGVDSAACRTSARLRRTRPCSKTSQWCGQPARHHERVRNEVQLALDQVAAKRAERRRACARSSRSAASPRPGAEVSQEFGEGLRRPARGKSRRRARAASSGSEVTCRPPSATNTAARRDSDRQSAYARRALVMYT